jgi:gliding motility-associated-like protein
MHIITDFVPCSDTATAIIQVDSLGPINIALTDSVLCRSTAVTFSGIYTGIGNTGVTWQFGDGDSVLNRNPVLHSFEGTGTFTVTATAYYRACPTITASRPVTLFMSPNVYLGSDTTICPGSNPIVLSDKNSLNGQVKWKWNTGQTTPTITIVAPGTYWVDAALNGCHGSDTIEVLKDCYMNIPNVFSPNGDGMNDYFYPRQYLTKGLTSFSLHIYNRWGQELFASTSTDGEGWDGKYNGVNQPEGVYIYVIDATFKDGQKEHHQGNVTLLR